MVRGWITRFMAGRYGVDQFNVFLLALYMALYLLSLFVRWMILDAAVMALILLCLYRPLSRNLERRRAENARFLQIVRPVWRRWAGFRARTHDKEHRYFKCPNCGQMMRVPRGKGRITVHCRSCGAAFEEKS